jgi:acyl-CoA thioesterase FadM
MLGRAVISSGRLGVTRSLAVRYLRPTPLHTPLRVEAVVGRAEGRNVEVAGHIWAPHILTCEAEGVFTCVDEQRFRL